jgi:septal ring factor EnvC (AmiA/AmiB activator)
MISRISGRTTRCALIAGFAAGVALGSPLPLAAQTAPQTTPDKSVPLDALKQHDQELEAAREAQRKSGEQEAVLKREIEQIGSDRRKFNQDLIDTAARLRAVESKIAATEARLAPLDDNESSIRKSLDGRRALIGQVLAALQRIGHRPPPALISSPEDALQAVRTAMVLGAVLPEMRHEVDALSSDLAELLDVRKKIAAERDRPKWPRSKTSACA